MANVKISMALPYACAINADLDAGLVLGPTDVEFNDSIYVYAEGATPAAAIQAVMNLGRTPSPASIERMEQQLLNTVPPGDEPGSELLQLIENMKTVVGMGVLPEGFVLPEGMTLEQFLEFINPTKVA